MQAQHRGITSSILSMVIVVGAGFIDFFALRNGIPKATDGNHDVVIMVITAWNGLALNVCSYFFGNSANSDRKTELLAGSTPAQTTTATTADATITTTPAATPPTTP